MTPRVSVCIPTFNRAPLVREAIQSVLAQFWDDLELVVSDDASMDETESIVRGFNDVRIRYLRQSNRLGLARNLRAVIEQAAGEFVAVLSDDDIMLPHHLSNALVALEQFPQAAYYACTALRFQADSSEEWRPVAVTDTQTPLQYFAPHQAAHFLGIDTPGQIITLVARRNRFHSHLFWGKPDFIPIDLLLMTQLMVQGGFLFANPPGIRYRVHRSNSSRPVDVRTMLKMNSMTWYAIRFLAHFLVETGVCPWDEIEQRGLHAASSHHVVQLVTALSEFRAPLEARRIARHVFDVRTDMDAQSARFRLARRLGFWIIPLSVALSQFGGNWFP